MSYDLQLEMKRKQVENAFSKIAHLEDVKIHDVLGMEDPWRYRNNVQIPVGEKDGKLITGFYQPRSHHIVPDMKTCVIQEERGDRKSTRLNSSHVAISYAVFCLKKKNKII